MCVSPQAFERLEGLSGRLDPNIDFDVLP